MNTMLSGISALGYAPGAMRDEAVFTDDMQRHRDAWTKQIDHFLIEWGRNASCLEDDEITPPSAEILRRAADIAMQLRDGGCPAPSRTILTVDGEIAFERYTEPSCYQSLRVTLDGPLELLTFGEGRLISRELVG